jgi:hypothetical protein
VACGFFLLEMAPVAAFPLAAGADPMGTGRGRGAIFEPVNTVIAGADRWGVEGENASDLGQARLPSEVVDPLGDTGVVEQEHQEKRPQQTDGIVGRPPAWAWGIQGLQQRAGGSQMQAQQHEGGIPPGVRKAARLAAQPALELCGKPGGILGVTHGEVLLLHKGGYECQP